MVDGKTANKDEYGTMLQQVNTWDVDGDNILQPIPDYTHWVYLQKLYYVSDEKN